MSVTAEEMAFLAEGLKGRVVFLAARPGAGKGTVAKKLLDLLPGALNHLSTGELFRAEAATGSQVGAQMQRFMTLGQVIPHNIVGPYLNNELSQEKYKSFGSLIDGYPKDVTAAEFLLEDSKNFDTAPKNFDTAPHSPDGGALVVNSLEPFMCVSLDVPRSVVVERLTGRLHCANKACGHDFHVKFLPPKAEGKCDHCAGELVDRADDTPDAINKRQEVFEKHTVGNLARFEKAGIAVRVDGNQAPDVVFRAVVDALLEKLKRRYAEVIASGMNWRCLSWQGRPSCGKGTQCSIVEELIRSVSKTPLEACSSFFHCSTGALFRAEVAAGTETGRAFKAHMDKGELVPQNLVDKFLTSVFAEDRCKRFLALDGYPRELPALDFVERVLPENSIEFIGAILLDVPRDVVVKRITGRLHCGNAACGADFHELHKKPAVEGVCDKCSGVLAKRGDDGAVEAVTKRMDSFDTNTTPVLDKLRAEGRLVTVDASKSISDVTLQVLTALRNMVLKQRQHNWYPRPTPHPKGARFHGHIDAKNINLLTSISTAILRESDDFHIKLYPIHSLRLGVQTRAGSPFAALYKCLPNFHLIKGAHDEAFATTRFGDAAIDYDLLRATLEECFTYGTDDRVMTEVEEEVFVGNFKNHEVGAEVDIETDTMQEEHSFDWAKLAGAAGNNKNDWQSKMVPELRQTPHGTFLELHHAVNIGNGGDESEQLPIPLDEFHEWAEKNDFSLGGSFIFRSKGKMHSYRTNEFTTLPLAEAHARLMKQADALLRWVKAKQQEEGCAWKGREVTTGFSIEIVWGIWHVEGDGAPRPAKKEGTCC